MNEKELLGKYKLVVGLEIHLHVDTDTKMFCRCSTGIYGQKPNTHTCPVCLGLPGALPVPNPEAIRKIQVLGLGLNCTLNESSRFDRKHYFYPDLPKGYQISQYKQPFCISGSLKLKNGITAEIERIHLEEDTAKSLHTHGKTLIDFNMSGMPLVEIVTTPCFRSINDAVEFSKEVQKTVRELGLGDVDMEKGQMRLEPNISLRTEEMEQAGELAPYKVEIKNINSFRFMEKAILAEIKRQKEIWDKGETPIQENRGFLEAKGETVSQRKKEQAHDYRYFPEPDIPPFEFDKKYMDEIHNEYEERRKNSPSYIKQEILSHAGLAEPQFAEKVERLKELYDTVVIEKAGQLINKGQDKMKVINLFLNKKDLVNLSIEEIEQSLKAGEDKTTDEDIIEKAVDKVLRENTDAVENYKKGKESAIQFLMGMVMRETKGKADAQKSREIILRNIR